jgi:DNA-binding PadR family transcriptional regulator
MNQRLRITIRDRKILTLLGEYGCVTGERIKNYFWSSTPMSSTHYRRLGILKRHELIENVTGDGAMTIGYRLTKKGKEHLAKISVATTSVSRRGYKTPFEHDQLLIDVRRIFEASPIVKEFRTESEVRRELFNGHRKILNFENEPIVPDATFVFEVPGQKMKVAIELELTPKTKRRYTKIFRSHLLSKDWNLVIYIVKNDKFRQQLMKTQADIRVNDLHIRIAKHLNGIYFCSLEEFLSKRLSVPMTNGKKEISLEQIAKNFGLSTDLKTKCYSRVALSKTIPKSKSWL